MRAIRSCDDRCEVLVGTQAIRLERGLVPARPVFAATADIGDHVDAALLQPCASHAAAIGGLQRDLEAAVAVLQGGIAAVGLEILRRDFEVGHAGAVLGGGEVLAHVELRGIEEAGAVLDGLPFALVQHAVIERGGLQEAGDGEEVGVAAVVIHAAGGDGGEGRCAAQRSTCPLARSWREHLEPVHHVVHHVEDQVMARPRIRIQRRGIGRREQHGDLALACHVVVELRCQQRARLIGLAAHVPVAAGFDQQPFAMCIGVGIVGHVDLGELAVLAAHIGFAVVEGELAKDEIALEAWRVVAYRGDRHVVVFHFIHGRRAGQRCAALPFLHDARVARLGHRAGTEIGGDVDVVAIHPVHVALGFGQVEAVLHELLVGEIELADHARHRHRRATTTPGSGDRPA